MIHVLLPAFNEEKALATLFTQLEQSLSKDAYHIWLVNDGSTDQTAIISSEWKKQIPLTLISHKKNQGLGQTFRTGLHKIMKEISESDIIVTMDADGTHLPVQIPSLINPILQGKADITIASRFVGGAKTLGVPLHRHLMSYGAGILFSFLFGVRGVRDYTCGFRAYNGLIMQQGMKKWQPFLEEDGFAVAAEWLLKLSYLKPRIEEIPFILHYDKKLSKSHMPLFKTIYETLTLMKRLRYIHKMK